MKVALLARKARIFTGVVLTCLLSVVGLHGWQAKPNFTGQWMALATPTTPAETVVIVHTDTEIKIIRVHPGKDHEAIYALNGTEKRDVVGVLPNQMIKTAKAEWSGNQVVITEITDRSDGIKLEKKSVWSLGADGQLILEATMSGVPQGPARARVVYRKK